MRSFAQAGRGLVYVALVVFLCGLLEASAADGAILERLSVPRAQMTQEEAAARYVENLRRLLETQVLPALGRGVVNLAPSSRPPGLTIDVTDDPAPYDVGATIAPDGSFVVRLSLGYVTMHDAALDAVVVARVLNRPEDLRRYLVYQLDLAHENWGRRKRGVSTQHAMSFSEFLNLDPTLTQSIFAQPEQRAFRDHVQVESLGWMLANLLVRADPTLAGTSLPQSARASTGAARLAAASGWFPVPPFATALGFAEIERSASVPFNGRALLCRAADLMQAGIAGLRANTLWRSRLKEDASLKRRVTEIQAQIASQRQHGQCGPKGSLTAHTANEAADPMATMGFRERRDQKQDGAPLHGEGVCSDS